MRVPDADVRRVDVTARARWQTLAVTALVAAVTSGVTALGGWWYLRPEPPDVIRFDIAPSGSIPFTVSAEGVNVAISPDGTKVVYHVQRSGNDSLNLRRFDQLDSQPIPGTDQARYPVFSPDGNSIAFVKDGKLYRLTLDANSATALCDVFNVAGLSWTIDDTIVFSQAGTQGGLYRVPAAGGKPERLAAPDTKAGEEAYIYPELLPDGSAVLFTIRMSGADIEEARIAVRSFASGEQKVLVEGGSFARYVPTGHLLYAQAGTLMAAAFNADRLEVDGGTVAVQPGVVTKGNGVANYAIANDGTLVYVPGTAVAYVIRFVWRDRSGKLIGAAVPEQLDFPRYPRISPDGRRLAATLGPSYEAHVWIFDLAGNRQPLKLTLQAHNTSPLWTVDGTRILFESTRDGTPRNLFVVPSDGSVLAPERLVSSDNDKEPVAWTADGRDLVFQENNPQTKWDLWIMPLQGNRKPVLWLQTSFMETEANLSPDRRWIAYVSDQTGEPEVWVRPFPEPGSPVRVSPKGGHAPVCRAAAGSSSTRKATAEMVASQPELRFRAPRVLFEGGFVPTAQTHRAATTSPRMADSS
jgi:Tol biopolymer transport system component